ncbi:hypothetical protein [Lentilactobacillus diolivorans]|uniref:Uncharacterized protein n=1 Tax=Lentilactobacillus diolivorans TaxID=179838 RepID=A0ABQ0XGC0_9LACO|nr:hypothetical protein [Lentilactobacillus diolivorans]GEP25112.1 hypothetical protein LDI01_27050 [Lentilactobacillus diolivorans]
MKSSWIRTLYMYVACLICLVIILITSWVFLDNIAELIWPDNNGLAYVYQEMFSSGIMLIASIGLFIFHWKHAKD